MKRLLIALFAAIVIPGLMAVAQEEMSIPFNDSNIFGMTWKPENTPADEPHGLLIVCHGFNGTHLSGTDYYRAFNDAGYEVYAFDFPGGSLFSRSDSNTMNMSIPGEVETLQTVIAHHLARPDIDHHKIILLGESQGGLVTLLAAPRYRDNIERIIYIFPAFCIPDNWEAHYPDIKAIPDTTKLWGVPLSRKFFVELRDINHRAAALQYTGPVLIVYGSADQIVSSESINKIIPDMSDATIKVIPGAGHGFNPDEKIIMTKHINEFLAR